MHCSSDQTEALEMLCDYCAAAAFFFLSLSRLHMWNVPSSELAKGLDFLVVRSQLEDDNVTHRCQVLEVGRRRLQKHFV